MLIKNMNNMEIYDIETFTELVRQEQLDESIIRDIFIRAKCNRAFTRVIAMHRKDLSHEFSAFLLEISHDKGDIETIRLILENQEDKAIRESLETAKKNAVLDISKRFFDRQGVSPLFSEFMINPTPCNEKLQDDISHYFSTLDQIPDDEQVRFGLQELTANIIKTIQEMPNEDKEYLSSLFERYPELLKELNNRSKGMQLGDRMSIVAKERDVGCSHSR